MPPELRRRRQPPPQQQLSDTEEADNDFEQELEDGHIPIEYEGVDLDGEPEEEELEEGLEAELEEGEEEEDDLGTVP
jgi:hypothetical protein